MPLDADTLSCSAPKPTNQWVCSSDLLLPKLPGTGFGTDFWKLYLPSYLTRTCLHANNSPDPSHHWISCDRCRIYLMWTLVQSLLVQEILEKSWFSLSHVSTVTRYFLVETFRPNKGGGQKTTSATSSISSDHESARLGRGRQDFAGAECVKRNYVSC